MRYLSIVALLAFVLAGFVATGCENKTPVKTDTAKAGNTSATKSEASKVETTNKAGDTTKVESSKVETTAKATGSM